MWSIFFHQINKIKEMSLSANQERAEMERKRLSWKVEGSDTGHPSDSRGAPVDPVKLVVELAPMEVRTFILDLDSDIIQYSTRWMKWTWMHHKAEKFHLFLWWDVIIVALLSPSLYCCCLEKTWISFLCCNNWKCKLCNMAFFMQYIKASRSTVS